MQAGSFQVCAGKEAGSEAAIHAIYDFYQQDETETVLPVDADNAFSSINRKAMLQKISIIITCPVLYRELLLRTSQVICYRES